MITTLTFTPGPPLTRESITFTNATPFTHAFQHRSRMSRPIYKFTLRLGPLTLQQMNSLSALHAYYQGSLPFYWDGGEYGRVENYNLVGEGNGTETSFYLPNRNIGVGSFSVQTKRNGVSSVWATSYSLSSVPGKVTFGTAPMAGDDILAKYGCIYRLNFDPKGLTCEEIASCVYKAELVMVENVLT